MIEATALRALGILGGESLVRLMDRLRDGDAALEDDLSEMERAATLLALTAPAAAAPPELRRRVLSRIAADGYYSLRERESEWEPAGFPGTYLRRLFIDSRKGEETRLVRLMPSAPPGALAELAGASLYVISGDLNVDGERLEIGDYFYAAGAAPLGRTDQGCVLFTTLATGVSRGKSRTRVIVGAAAGKWREIGPGVAVKELGADEERGIRMDLQRMEPGASWESHRHEGAEELFLVRGDWRCLGTIFRPGDFHRAGSGTEHETTSSSSGCKMIVIRHFRSAT